MPSQGPGVLAVTSLVSGKPLGPESGDGEDDSGLGGESLQLGKCLIEVQLSTAKKLGTCGPWDREGATTQGP